MSKNSNQVFYTPKAFLILENKVFPVRPSTTTIGRRLSNHLVLSDMRISRLHAQIQVIDNQYFIFDLNSTGGTFVNGERVVEAPLFSGDQISLAGYPLTFVFETDSVSFPVGADPYESKRASEDETKTLI
jgi:pSer/pThr/pTyr-binding forkhead associated (FHA) protein